MNSSAYYGGLRKAAKFDFGKKTAQQGLDDAVAGGNKLLRKFEKSNQ